ncbi:hypothetical protein SAMN04488065_1002 [Haloplanus vescus]|uniref:Uncharacterized protein n=1 Tax=Haloplanus vescus TaxID=555874 RepID=A0A1H3WQQ6_9EURY|nr:hypothetical protein SAMN04488065_1002 [Haloplanus vescus]
MSIPSSTGDELAGVVDLFGALTRDELESALDELAFKRGESADEDAIEATVADAIEAYYLVAVDEDDESLLVPGPVAFPTLSDGAEDLPHIMDVPDRTVDRETLVEAVERRLRADAASAVDDGDTDRIEHLLDVSYDLETWGDTDASEIRERLDDALENRN